MKSMSDAWDDIKALKTKRNSLREKLQKRKKERHGILKATATGSSDRKCSTVKQESGAVTLEEELNMDASQAGKKKKKQTLIGGNSNNCLLLL